MGKVDFIKVGDILSVRSPYKAELLPLVKKLGGKWDFTARVWKFELSKEREVRQLYEKVYGGAENP